MPFSRRRAHPLTFPQMMWVGGALVFGTIVTLGLLGGLRYPPVAEAAAPASSYEETFTAGGDVAVRLSCTEGTLVATTAAFSNQFGVGGGDVAVAVDLQECRSEGPARYVGPVPSKGSPAAYLYCRGTTLIATTPAVVNPFGVSGASVALSPGSKLCQ